MSLPGRQAHQSLLYRHDMPQRTTMLPWYHLHSNVKTFLIRPITGSSVVSYCCSPVQKRCLEATFCHCLAKTPSSLWVSLSVGACCILLFRTTLSRIILAKKGAVVKGYSGCLCRVNRWQFIGSVIQQKQKDHINPMEILCRLFLVMEDYSICFLSAYHVKIISLLLS